MKIDITERNLDRLTIPEGRAQLVVWDTRLPGFGAVVGRLSQAFVVNYRTNGAWKRETIGRRGAAREDGTTWTATLARQRALELLGQVAGGIDIQAKREETKQEVKRASGPTLRQALKFHVEKMERGENRRGKVCSPRSVATLRGGVELHLADYLDRPLVTLTADELDKVRERIERNTPRRGDADARNPPGRALANRLLANVSAIWRSWHKRHGLPVSNPTERLIAGALHARDNRIANHALPEWHAKVMAMENHVRRDLQRVALFIGVRTDGVRSLRWDDIDFDEDLIQVKHAKGDRPYTLPMVETVRDILEARRDENPVLFGPHGGDGGYVFPSVARDGKTVIAVAEPKERRVKRDARGQVVRDDEGNVIRETYLPGVQACRKTFNSVAIEIGIPKEAREALMNHEGRGVNVRSYGFPQNWDYLRSCAEQIEAALWARIRGESARRSRRAR